MQALHHSPLCCQRAMVLTTQQKAAAAAAASRLVVHATIGDAQSATRARMAKHASLLSSSSPSSPSQASTITITSSVKQQQEQQQQQQELQKEQQHQSIRNSVSTAAATAATAARDAPIAEELSTEFSKLYRNNPHQVLPIEIIITTSSHHHSNTASDATATQRRRIRNEQLIQSAVTLCPELVLSTLPKLDHDHAGYYDSDGSSSASCCYYWRFASKLDDDDDDDEAEHHLRNDDAMVVFISVWSSSPSASSLSKEDPSSSENELTKTKFMIPLHIRPLEGGLSNLLYIVENPCTTATTTGSCATPRSVLVRIHPSCKDDVVNREYENKLLAWLSRRRCPHHHTATAATSTASANSNHKKNNNNNIGENVMMTTSGGVLPVPVFYGRFLNGRVEEFYDNVRPLTCYEMAHNAQYASDAARLLARMHCTTLQQQQQQQALDLDDDDDACPLLHETMVLQCGRDAYPGDIVPRVNAWFRRLDNVLRLLKKKPPLSSPSPSSSSPSGSSSVVMMKEETNSLVALVCWLKHEWQWVQSQLFHHDKSRSRSNTTSAAARDFCRQVVLTHMDAQSLNLLVPANNDSYAGDDQNNNGQGQNDNDKANAAAAAVDMKLIDFEYAGFNPRAADIANTFCEHCDMNNLRAKWQVEYPTLQQQEYFLRAYLDELVALPTSSSSSSSIATSKYDDSSSSILQQYYINSRSDKDKNEFVTALCHEISRYTLVSHLSWAVWGCVQHVNRYSSSSSTKDPASSCGCNDRIKDDEDDDDFDYLAYARHRIDGYRYFQERFMSNVARI
jgi:thiamine kinase-like enzyme